MCTITAGTLFTSCGSGMKHVLHMECVMLHVVCVYAKIFDAFQPIDTLQSRKKIKGGQGNHHGAMNKSSSKHQNHGGMTIITV